MPSFPPRTRLRYDKRTYPMNPQTKRKNPRAIATAQKFHWRKSTGEKSPRKNKSAEQMPVLAKGKKRKESMTRWGNLSEWERGKETMVDPYAPKKPYFRADFLTATSFIPHRILFCNITREIGKYDIFPPE